MYSKEEIASWFKSLQADICKSLEATDTQGKFAEDVWQRPEGGGGRSRVLTEGLIIEKGGVNFSAVHGETPERILKALKLEKADFFATGVSIVIHPYSPMVPIIHMNVRYFEMSNGTCWFGGGIDLTPHYINTEDAAFFHEQLKQVCDRHQPNFYPKFKEWADDYFYIRHRQETRGVGGIFFDRLSPGDESSQEDIFHFVQDVGKAFAPVYTHLMKKNKDIPFEKKAKEWQLLRRGRYVEFNLVLDKGTKFGLDTNGRIESILMSLPPQANWRYNYQVEPGSPEEDTQKKLRKGINWLSTQQDDN